MRVIDGVQPDLLVSLHNSDTGGAYYMTSENEPRLVALLATAAARHGLGLERMPNDCIGWETPGRGVFVLPGPTSASKEDDWQPSGASSAHYAARHGALGLFPEVPIWRTRPLSLTAERGARMRRS